jgi:hypothetical protein
VKTHRGVRGWGFHIFYTVSSQMAVKLSALFTSCPLPPQESSWYSFLLEAELTPGPHCSWKDQVNWKNPMTSSGIEPLTFQLVAQCLNQLCYCMPLTLSGPFKNVKLRFPCSSFTVGFNYLKMTSCSIWKPIMLSHPCHNMYWHVYACWGPPTCKCKWGGGSRLFKLSKNGQVNFQKLDHL